MWFECEKPFLSGERCVTSRKTAAKETRMKWVKGKLSREVHVRNLALCNFHIEYSRHVGFNGKSK